MMIEEEIVVLPAVNDGRDIPLGLSFVHTLLKERPVVTV